MAKVHSFIKLDVDEDSEDSILSKESNELKPIELKAQDLENVIKIYEAVCEYRECKKDEEQLNQKLTRIASILKEALSDEISLCLRNAAILKAKGELLGMAFEKLSAESSSTNLWKIIKAEYDTIIRECLCNMECHKLKEGELKTQELTKIIKDLEEELGVVNEEKEKLQKALEEKNKVITKVVRTESPLKDIRPAHFNIGVKSYPTAKFMSLKQLKDTITDIYQQKTRYDEKAIENHQPRENMQQYMNTYLNQIYGLKSLTIEGVGGIMRGIKKYGAVDSEVALFGKILNNECDEDFRFVFTEVKIAMENILKEKLKSKHKLKTETEINRMVNEIQQGTINRGYWSAIIGKMYNEEHFEILSKKIREKIELDKKLIKTSNRKPSTERVSNEILYSDLQKIILDFQLTTHEKYIQKFTKLFKGIDVDKNGLVNEVEFRELIARMKVPIDEEGIESLLQTVDPYDNQKISYSECISLFSSVNVGIE